jgi:hypothetical protein
MKRVVGLIAVLVAGGALASFATSGTFNVQEGAPPIGAILHFACLLTGSTDCEMSGPIRMNGQDIQTDANHDSRFELSTEDEIGVYLNGVSLTTFHEAGQYFASGKKIAWPTTGETITNANGITVNTDDGLLNVCQGTCPGWPSASTGLNSEAGASLLGASYLEYPVVYGYFTISQAAYGYGTRAAMSLPGTVADGLHIGLASTSAPGYNLQIVPVAYLTKSWAKAASNDPKLWVMSSTDPDTAKDQTIWITHNQSDGYIGTDKGELILNPSSDLTTALSTTNSTNAVRFAFTAETQSATTATTGFGSGIYLDAETTTGVIEHAGSIYSQWTTPTTGAAKSKTCIQSSLNSTLSYPLCLNSDGSITWPTKINFYTIPAARAGKGAAAPTEREFATFYGLGFGDTNDTALFQWEIPDQIDTGTNPTLYVYWTNTAGDAIAAGETVNADVTYRIVNQDALSLYDRGAVATGHMTYTQSGAGVDKQIHVSSIPIESTQYLNQDQPVVAGWLAGFSFKRIADTYSGELIVIRWEIGYSATGPISHN